MQTILLDKGYVALVDDEDYEDLIQFNWKVVIQKGKRSVYAQRRWHKNGIRYSEFMHKRITGFNKTDHINMNGLDNRRSNLRNCTQSQNKANETKRAGSYSSKYKGVYWSKNAKKWCARIKVNYKYIYLGYFVDEDDAARAYDAAAVLHFGEFARCNF